MGIQTCAPKVTEPISHPFHKVRPDDLFVTNGPGIHLAGKKLKRTTVYICLESALSIIDDEEEDTDDENEDVGTLKRNCVGIHNGVPEFIPAKTTVYPIEACSALAWDYTYNVLESAEDE